MKRNKACGPDINSTAEMLQATEDFSVDKITSIANQIYDTGEFQNELMQSIFIAIPKKAGASECELHRTISLMSVVTKIILEVLLMRIRSKLRPEINQVQCGFTEDTGTRNAIFILRNLCERSIEVSKDLFLCFTDYTKAFEKVRHETLLDMLQELEIDGNDSRVIRNLYWNQESAV